MCRFMPYYHRADHISVNMERFAGLNFHIFHGFQEYHKTFFVNIYLYIQSSYNAIVYIF